MNVLSRDHVLKNLHMRSPPEQSSGVQTRAKGISLREKLSYRMVVGTASWHTNLSNALDPYSIVDLANRIRFAILTQKRCGTPGAFQYTAPTLLHKVLLSLNIGPTLLHKVLYYLLISAFKLSPIYQAITT